MATTLLKDEDIEPKLLALVREARDWVWLVSPYLQLWGHLKDAVRLAVTRGVRVLVVVRADRSITDNEHVSWLVQNGVDIAVCENLHAKIYMSEQSALVTSMNLYTYSSDNSHEIALNITDAGLARQIRRYVTDSFLVSANLINAKKDAGKVSIKESSGFCIRCGQRMTFNRNQPLCPEDFEVWANQRNESYPENFCHSCGSPTAVNSARPLCEECYKKRRQ